MNAVAQLKPKLTADDLAQAWMNAKEAENRANAERVKLEEQIVALLGAKEEGAQTHELPSGLKIEIAAKMTYKADMPKLLTLLGPVPEQMRPIKVETRLDETGCKYLRANEPEVWKHLAQAITATPAKTGVKVKI